MKALLASGVMETPSANTPRAPRIRTPAGGFFEVSIPQILALSEVLTMTKGRLAVTMSPTLVVPPITGATGAEVPARTTPFDEPYASTVIPLALTDTVGTL